jgi:hypothetical protein
MTAYHLRFRNLDTRTITATQTLLDARTSRLPHDQAHAEFQRWLDQAARIYHLPPVQLQITPPGQCHWTGRYLAPATILMPAHRITALLHQFRHHMQACGTPLITATTDPAHDAETDARAWSQSLYHTARPHQFARLATEGKIPHATTQPATELTTT